MASLPSLDQLPTPPSRSAHLLREAVYDVLKGAIIGGTLPPGERLRDGEIADQLEVSKMPVREALRRLADEGLVIAEANRWTKVAPIDMGAATRIYPIIWTLECLALRLVPSWTEARLDRLRAANRDLERALADADPVAAAAADDTFHGVILEAADNQELTATVLDLKVRVRRIEVAYFGGSMTGEKSCREHDSVVAALAAGEIDVAAAALEQNWSGTLDRIRGHDDLRTTDEGAPQ